MEGSTSEEKEFVENGFDYSREWEGHSESELSCRGKSSWGSAACLLKTFA